MRYDYHVHSTYSDGAEMAEMAEAAEAAGLEGLGFADHCNVSATEPGTTLGYDLDETYGERRRELRALRESVDLRLVDAVEMDYRPEDEERIEAFLEEAEFELAIGSVHHVGRRDVATPAPFVDDPEDALGEFVDRYYDLVVDLIGSELFDVVAHLDLTERNPQLRGYGSEDHYRRVAAAFDDSRTVPELNAGRVFRGPEEIHPHPAFLDVLQGAGVAFATGTDSHVPEEIGERVAYIEDVVAERSIETVDLV